MYGFMVRRTIYSITDNESLVIYLSITEKKSEMYKDFIVKLHDTTNSPIKL